MKNNSIDLASLILQILNLQILFQDFNNTDLMQQLKVIIEQNEEILTLLRKEEKEWTKKKKN